MQTDRRLSACIAIGVLFACSALTSAHAQVGQAATSAREIMGRAEAKKITAFEVSRRDGELVIDTADAAVKVTNSEVVPVNVTSLPVVARIVEDGPGSVKIRDLSMQITNDWNKLSGGVKGRFPAVTRANGELAAAVEQLSEGKPEAIAKVRVDLAVTQQAILAEYVANRTQKASITQPLVEAYRQARRAGKAIFGTDDRYPPAAYQRIFDMSRVAFGLARRGEPEPKCSGVLIGLALALTNEHCIVGEMPSDLEARFDYENDLSGIPLKQRVFPIVGFKARGNGVAGAPDFALLELGAEAASLQLPGAVYAKPCLGTSRVRREAPVYVIGHPKGLPRTVHDNAFVYFPFELTADEFAELELDVRDEFEESEDKDVQLASFRKSYRGTPNGSDTTYKLYSERFGRRPTIGINADTFHGNSGSPVFSRKSHQIVGLLYDGAEDFTQPLQAGWRSHEAVVPIGVILEQITASFPAFRAEHPDVCVL